MKCIKFCYKDYTEHLNGKDKVKYEFIKVCLAKCVDRARDYLNMEFDKINPYD